MPEFKAGDRVKVPAFEGMVTEAKGEFGCMVVNDDSGWNHWVFPRSMSVKIEKTREPFEPGALYRDNDGDTFQFLDYGLARPWKCLAVKSPSSLGSRVGVRYPLDYLDPSNPVKLVPEA